MVELEEQKPSRATAINSSGGSSNNNNNNNSIPRSSGDSGIGSGSGSGVSCSNTDNSCTQSQSGEQLTD